jgi:hypothetical protein
MLHLQSCLHIGKLLLQRPQFAPVRQLLLFKLHFVRLLLLIKLLLRCLERCLVACLHLLLQLGS